MSKKKKNKKVLNGYTNVVKNDIKEEKTEKNIHDKIQSFISILFTIIVFALIAILIIILYNNYLKKDNSKVVDNCLKYEEHPVDSEKVIKFINNTRNIIYNITSYDSDDFHNEELTEISKFIIWGSDSEYLECNDNDY